MEELKGLKIESAS